MKSLVVAVVVLAVLPLFRAPEAFLVIVGGLPFAPVFNSAARWFRARTGLSHAGSLTVSGVVKRRSSSWTACTSGG